MVFKLKYPKTKWMEKEEHSSSCRFLHQVSNLTSLWDHLDTTVNHMATKLTPLPLVGGDGWNMIRRVANYLTPPPARWFRAGSEGRIVASGFYFQNPNPGVSKLTFGGATLEASKDLALPTHRTRRCWEPLPRHLWYKGLSPQFALLINAPFPRPLLSNLMPCINMKVFLRSKLA